MAQKELMTEGLVCCHYYWSANYKVQYASSEEVKPQETLKAWLDGCFDRVDQHGGI